MRRSQAAETDGRHDHAQPECTAQPEAIHQPTAKQCADAGHEHVGNDRGADGKLCVQPVGWIGKLLSVKRQEGP